jgi:hypothetical protein
MSWLNSFWVIPLARHSSTKGNISFSVLICVIVFSPNLGVLLPTNQGCFTGCILSVDKYSSANWQRYGQLKKMLQMVDEKMITEVLLPFCG